MRVGHPEQPHQSRGIGGVRALAGVVVVLGGVELEIDRFLRVLSGFDVGHGSSLPPHIGV